MGLLFHNNSRKDEFHTQINNKRFPQVTCFNTSMINGGNVIRVKYPVDYAPQYSQLEDKYDYHIHNDPDVAAFVKANKDVFNLVNQGYDLREIYAVEEFAFNHWIGEKVTTAKYDLTLQKVLKILTCGGAIAGSGKWNNLAHVVTTVGFVYDCPSIQSDAYYSGVAEKAELEIINDRTSTLKEIIIDDSYGNPIEGYAKMLSGNDTRVPLDTYVRSMDKHISSVPTFYGCVFLPK